MSRASQPHVLTYSDVTADPNAFSRSKLHESQLDEARALGFGSLSWIAAMVDDVAPDTPPAMRGFVSAVMLRPGAPMTLSLAHVSEVGDDYCLKTLFTDGSIVMTESEPQKNAFRLKLGVSSAPRYGVDLAIVKMTSLADLVDQHMIRVRAHEAEAMHGTRPIAHHDLRAHLAMRKRWREIADPRKRLQIKIAVAFGIAALLAVVITPIVGVSFFTSIFGEAIAHVLRTAAFVGCVPIGMSAFTFALYYVAPVLARVAPAPAMRPANELLRLADDVGTGRLAETDHARAPAAATRAVVDVSSSELARLRRRDLVVTMLGALVFPIAAFAGMATVGLTGTWIVLSVVFTFDGLLAVVTKKTLVAQLREQFVPELVRAESSIQAQAAGAACAGKACILPRAWSGWLRIALGVLGMLAIRKVLTWPHEPVSLTVVAQWAFATCMISVTTLGTTKKRHEQLVAAH